jgi:hypothetical protein
LLRRLRGFWLLGLLSPGSGASRVPRFLGSALPEFPEWAPNGAPGSLEHDGVRCGQRDIAPRSLRVQHGTLPRGPRATIADPTEQAGAYDGNSPHSGCRRLSCPNRASMMNGSDREGGAR